MPFGGGGALHAGAMLDEVGIARAIVPRYPSVTSAMGCVIADMRQDFVQTINSLLDTLDVDNLTRFMQEHVDQGMATLDAAQSTFVARTTHFELDMAYIGQTHTVPVPIEIKVAGNTVHPPTLDDIQTAFDDAYSTTYGRLLNQGVRRILNLRSAITGQRPKFDLATLAPTTTDTPKPKATRPVHFSDAWHDTAIYDRLTLPVGAVITGPAILEQPDTTVLIEPGLLGRVDTYGNTIIEREGPKP
jgi:N-methylhydantoinase A